MSSVQPDHMTYSIPSIGNYIGEERSKNMFSFHSLGPVILGSDYPISECNPMRTISQAVNRITVNYPNGFMKKESLTVDEAIFTHVFDYHKNGFDILHRFLQPGDNADFVWLSKNLINIDKKEIETTKILKTFLNGVEIYDYSEDSILQNSERSKKINYSIKKNFFYWFDQKINSFF